jgi:pimeloyl-ACP methyl ester carboxylesterase
VIRVKNNEDYTQAYQRLEGRLLERAGVAVRARMVKLPSGCVHVLEAGAGEPVLILHGGGGVGAEHIPLLARLSQRFRVILPDRPGHGLSEDFDYRCDLERANVAFVAALLDELGLERASLVGNSYGGLMAVQFSLAHPERVSKLVILSFFPGINRKLPLMMRLMVAPVLGALLARTVGRPTVENTRKFFKMLLVAHVDRMAEELVELEALHSRRHASSLSGMFREGFTVRGVRPRYIVGEALPRLSVPTVFVWGERDPFMPVEEARRVAARIPGAQFVLIPDAGHLVTSDQPLETAAYLERVLGDR